MERQTEWVWRAILSLLLLLFIYLFTPVSCMVNNVGNMFLYPFLKGYCVIQYRIENVSHWFKSQQELEIQLRKVICERDQLAHELIELQSMQDYANDIKDIIIFKQRYKNFNEGLIGQILLCHCAEDEHYILVEGGKDKDICEGMLALAHNNLIGRVSDVYASYSKAILLTDRRMKVAGYCSKTKAQGIVVGLNEPCLELKFVAHTKHLRKNDLVMTSGQGICYPRGLCLGAIVDFVKHHVEYDITLAPLVNVQELSFCILLHPDKYISG